VATLVDAKDQDTVAKLTFGERAGSSLMDLAAHAIFDRGRLMAIGVRFRRAAHRVGDVREKKDKALHRMVDATEAYVRDQLGDARSFSLDSPKSRKPKIDVLRKLS